jgi:hypothetical protein
MLEGTKEKIPQDNGEAEINTGIFKTPTTK